MYEYFTINTFSSIHEVEITYRTFVLKALHNYKVVETWPGVREM